MIPENISAAFLSLITSENDKQTEIKEIFSLSGGCINNAVRIKTTSGDFFLKWNNSSRYPGMFEAEAKGLQLLASSQTLSLPFVKGTAQADGYDFIVMQYISPKEPEPGFWTNFGENLAWMHKNSSREFGLDHDNYIGSLPQYNTFKSKWSDFFIEQRLEVQADLALNSKKAGKELRSGLSKLYNRINEIFPDEPPALLHGDLWSGNFMTGERGEAVIIDPAVYYGHRYMDIGMSLLFGGFSPEFYNAYNNQYPFEENWKSGAEVANIYPLLVHVNLFGGGYIESVKSILKRFK